MIHVLCYINSGSQGDADTDLIFTSLSPKGETTLRSFRFTFLELLWILFNTNRLVVCQ